MSEKLDKTAIANEYQRKALENWSPVNWRAWGSWHGWGSPVGLGLFFIELAAAIWILFHLTWPIVLKETANTAVSFVCTITHSHALLKLSN